MTMKYLNYRSYIIHVKKGYEDRERSIIEQFTRLEMPVEWVMAYEIVRSNPDVLART